MFSESQDPRKVRLVRCAIEAFAGRGYRATSISLVVREAGIARSTFYQYFDSKLHLFQSILDTFLQDLRASIRPISLAPAAPTPLDQIQDNLTRVLNLVLGERDLTRIILHQTNTLDRTVVQKLEDLYSEAAGMIQRSLDLGVAMNLVRPCDTRLTSFSIVGAVKEVIFQFTSSQEPQPAIDDLVRELLGFGMGGILVQPRNSLMATARQVREPALAPNPARVRQ